MYVLIYVLLCWSMTINKFTTTSNNLNSLVTWGKANKKNEYESLTSEESCENMVKKEL